MYLLDNVEVKQLHNKEFALILHLDNYCYEFADECDDNNLKKNDLLNAAKALMEDKYSNLRITIIKVMVGGIVVTAFHLAGPASASAQAKTSEGRMSIPTQVHEPIPLTRKDPILSSNSLAAPRIILNGRALQTPATIINGATLVPIRAVCEHLGASVLWSQQSRSVTIVKEDTKISFIVGATIANINGKNITIPQAHIINGTTMVPLRFLGETLGLHVNSNDVSRTITITSEDYNRSSEQQV